MSRRLVMLIPFVLLGLAAMFVPLDRDGGAPMTHEVTVKASQFAFDPSVLHVNRGDRVVLTLQAADVVHGLYLDEYGVNIRAEPGTSRQVEFVADRAGKFRYRCSVSCGNLHPFMIGELIVAPNGMYWRATALALIAVSATLFHLWPRQEPIRTPVRHQCMTIPERRSPELVRDCPQQVEDSSPSANLFSEERASGHA